MRNSSMVALITLTLCGCGSSADDNSFTCEQADRSGTYWADFTTKSGNCGEQTDGLIGLDPAGGVGACSLLSSNWSEGDCKYEAHTVCPADSIAPGATVDTTAVTTQQDAAGDVIDGVMSFRILDGSGQALCVGSYGVHAVRQ